jgi:hypothetical protein
MTPATINSAALWANQVSALSAQRATRALAAASAGSSASGSAAAGGSGDLFADLISSLSHGAVTANNSSAATAATAATPAAGNAASGTTAPLGHAHGHGHGGGKHGSIQSLIDELNASSTAAAGTSGTAISADLANVNSAFSKLMTDLGAAGANSTASNAGTATAVSTASSSPPLRGLLQSLLQHVQQQGSFAASAGNLVHAVA